MGKIEKQKSAKHIVFLGESGFPVGLATIQRLTLMAKALQYTGSKAKVICRKGVWNKSQKINFDKQGSFEGIDYIYTSKSPFKPEGFLDRNIQKLKGMYGEYKHLKSLNKQGELDLAIISDMKVVHVLRYYMYSILLNFPIVINFVEMTSAMQHRTKFLKKVNDYLHDKWVIRLFDGALPISDKLMDYYNEIAPSKPSLKLPIICDFDKFDLPKNKVEPYFLYCGSIRYTEVRDFVIEAYKNIPEPVNAKLHMLISGGNEKETRQLEQELNSHFDTQCVKLFANIPYEELVQLYVDAMAVLIPLRNTVQDASRFPHKIGEYLASGNPVITTDVGEIKNYFEDEKTALVADNYSTMEFAGKMKFVLDNPEKAIEIGLKGKQMGLKEFDYKGHGRRMMEFMDEL